jgi:hypothetical protein
MRISKQWYDLSAPLLYRHIHCDSSITLAEILIGMDIEDKSDPAGKEVTKEGASPREMLSKQLDEMDLSGGPCHLKKALVSPHHEPPCQPRMLLRRDDSHPPTHQALATRDHCSGRRRSVRVRPIGSAIVDRAHMYSEHEIGVRQQSGLPRTCRTVL